MIGVQFDTVDAWLQDWIRRRDGGHHLQASDDDKNRTLGFTDLTADERVFIPVTCAMTTGPKVMPETLSSMNHPEAFRWPYGDELRCRLFHHDPESV